MNAGAGPPSAAVASHVQPSVMDLELAGFACAEAAAEEVVAQILHEGAKQLYHAYIERKSYSFASDAVARTLLAELQMCYVPYDRGEPLQQQQKPQQPQQRQQQQQALQQKTPEGEQQTREPEPSKQEPEQRESRPPTAEQQPQQPRCPSQPEPQAEPMPPVQPQEQQQAGASRPGTSSLPASAGGQEACRRMQHRVPSTGSGWALEEEPPRCRIDTWARSCVPVRKKLVRPRSRFTEDAAQAPAQSQRAGSKLTMTRRNLSQHSSASHSPSYRGGRDRESARARSAIGEETGGLDSTDKAGAGGAAKSPPVRTLIKFEEHVVVDEEEQQLRDIKERELRRRREEEARLQQKAAEEAEEAARLAQVKEQMNNRPYTFDSNGSVIWVQPPHPDRLPNANPVPHYSLKKDELEELKAAMEKKAKDAMPRKGAAAGYKRKADRQKSAPKEAEFVDGFEKFVSQQPSMMEVMQMAPGVTLSERGTSKAGERLTSLPQAEKPIMSRRDYEVLVLSTMATAPATTKEDKPVQVSTDGRQPSKELASKEPSVSLLATPAEHLHGDAPGEAGTEVATGDQPQPPPRLPMKPAAPPPSARRAHMKRPTLGAPLSARERPAAGTPMGARLKPCAPPPPVGATMGHGHLVPKKGEYFYPDPAP